MNWEIYFYKLCAKLNEIVRESPVTEEMEWSMKRVLNFVHRGVVKNTEKMFDSVRWKQKSSFKLTLSSTVVCVINRCPTPIINIAENIIETVKKLN